MNTLCAVSSVSDVPLKIRRSPYFLVLPPDGWRDVPSFLDGVPRDECVWLFVRSSYDLDKYLKIVEDRPGPIVMYVAPPATGSKLPARPVSQALASRFNLCLTRVRVSPRDVPVSGPVEAAVARIRAMAGV